MLFILLRVANFVTRASWKLCSLLYNKCETCEASDCETSWILEPGETGEPSKIGENGEPWETSELCGTCEHIENSEPSFRNKQKV